MINIFGHRFNFDKELMNKILSITIKDKTTIIFIKKLKYNYIYIIF